MKRSGLNGFVSYEAIDISDIVHIHKYLIKKIV